MTNHKYIEQLRRMKPRKVVEFIESPKFSRHDLDDLYKTPGCMHIHVTRKQSFSVCLECSRLDRSNMICTIGKC